jgi:CheY-like chemotaxis protein
LARKILLADDSVTAQNMGRRILSDAGYEVITVNNGSAALKKIAESKPDLIVLDVYMPGYGGLEVCQRLRESKETARIPVLLTVGKLEPFKPEEARRVRADAFIVKPFEASELLTALTKLEDRIVPQPAPYKPGRFAKAISALESDLPSNEYGDLESGWKNRLKIPVPQSHGLDLDPDEQGEQVESRKPEPRTEQKMAVVPAAMPRDITPEEIAAINAAAVAFGTQIAPPAAEPEATTTVPPVSPSEPVVKAEEAKAEEARPEAIADAGDDVAATFASVATAEETPAEPERVDAEQKNEPPVVEEVKADAAEAATNAAPEIQLEMPAPVEEVASATPVEAPPKPEERDDFAAALESLTPTNGNGVSQQFNGPRWAAELIAVTDAESALILEQEMQKAIAAMAVVNADEAGLSATVAEAPISTNADVSHQDAIEAPTAEFAVAASQEVGNEASTSLVAAMINQTALPTLSDLVDAVLPRASDEAPIPEPQGAAFAAAAAGSGDAISQSTVPAEVPPSAVSPANPDERQRESELAAAWESWKHIRESIAEPQLTTQAADAPASTPALQAEQASSPQVESDDETAGQDESVASIVDSVLADLKPKLMEEISRKMGKEKKRR